MKYYSLQGQDKWALDLLGHEKDGYFVDIGAHDGKHCSNTYVMEQLGWDGICVEPNPNLRGFPSLIENRKCICENLCIFSEETEVDFVARGRRPQGSGIVMESANRDIDKLVERGHPVIKVKAITLEQLLDKHNAPSVIDYINIDTEGSEYEILKVFNFNKYRFKTLTIEHNYFEGQGYPEAARIKRENIRNLLEANGYKFDKAVVADDWYTQL